LSFQDACILRSKLDKSSALYQRIAHILRLPPGIYLLYNIKIITIEPGLLGGMLSSIFKAASPKAQQGTILRTEPDILSSLAIAPTQLKETLPNFIGRKELLITLAKNLIPTSYQRGVPSQVQVLWGLPGIGKSELAVAFANQWCDRFCKVWIIHSETLEANYAKLAEHLQIFRVENRPFDQLQQLVYNRLQELASHTQKPYLLIFDNVESSLQEIPRGGSILITARTKDVYENVDAYQEVPAFKLEDAKALYQRQFRTDPLPELEELLKESEGFPLLISAVLYLSDNPTGFRDIFQESKAKATLRDHVDKRYQRKLEAVFQKFLEQFASKNPEAYHLLQVLSHLNPSQIPLGLVKLYKPSDLQELTSVERWNLINALTSSLVRYTDDSKETFAMHRITQDVCKALQIDTTPYHAVLSLVAKFAKGFDANKQETRDIGRSILIHGVHLRQNNEWGKGDAAIKWSLLNSMGRYELTQGIFDQALQFYQEALQLALKIHGQGHVDVAASYHSVGVTLGKLGKHAEALEYDQKALMLRKALLGEKDLDVAKSYNNVGYTLGKLRKYEDALEHYQNALELRRTLLGENHVDVAESYDNVGYTLGKLGKHKDALKNEKNALELRRVLLEEKHVDVAESYNNVGITLEELKRPKEALEHHQNALELRRALLGEKHVDVAASYHSVGYTLEELKRPKEALESHLMGFSIHCEVFKEVQPDHITLLENIIQLLDQQPDVQIVEQAKQKALPLCIEKFGENHELTQKLKESGK
jgi:tetratricopeptide (TPR) repeat protein